MFKTEESKIGVVMLLTGTATLVTSLIEAAGNAPYMVPIIYASMAAMLVLIIICSLYQRRVKKRRVDVQDERSALHSLKSTRNGFIVAMLTLAAYMIMGELGASLTEILALPAIWGMSFAAYTLSYMYYNSMA